jgi:hypothetical protein
MLKNLSKLIPFLLAAPLLFVPKKALAVTVGLCIPTLKDGCVSNFSAAPYEGYGGYIYAIYQFSILLGGTLTVMMLMYAGFIYLTSQGDTSKLNQAKEILFGSILGFVLLLFLGLILKFLGLPSFGT